MAKWRDQLRTQLQWAIVRAQRNRVAEQLLRWLCQAGTWNVGRTLMKQPGVEAVYVRHTHPWSNSFVVGHSDLDITVALTDEAGEDPNAIRLVASRLETRRLIHYYLSPEDARITTRGELARYARDFPPVEIDAPEWTLLAGRDLRITDPQPLEPHAVPFHPEFNRWWGHILQNYLLLPLPGLEDRYHRVFVRGARKQLAYFEAAKDSSVASKEDEAITADLQPLLSGLEARGFWNGRENALRERIFHHVLAATVSFFRHETPPAPGDATNLDPAPPATTTDGDETAAALEAKLESIPGLIPLLAGVLTYPTPYCHPFHQADLLVPQGMSVKALTELLSLLRAAFHGREFEAQGRHFSIALVPEEVYESALPLRGSPFPFLPEHVVRTGRTLFRDKALSFDTSFARADHVEWCRMFFAYFQSNLARRVDHSSRTLNFAQLASVRLFLATNEIATDVNTLPERHRETFGEESPSPDLWDYLLRDKPGRGDPLHPLAAATLAAEAKAVEALLEAGAAQSAGDGDFSKLA